MTKDKEARVTLSLFNQDFNKAIKETKQETSQLNKEYELQKQQMKYTATETEKLAAKIDYLNAKQELASRTTEETVQQYERVKAQFGENSQEAQKMAVAVTEAKIAEQKLANELIQTNQALERAKQAENELKSEVDQTTASLDKQKKSASDTAEQLKAVGESAKGAGESLTAGLTTPLAAVGTGALLAATQFDTAQAQIQGQLGVTAEEAAHLGDVAQAVWEKGFGEDVVQVTSDLTLLKQQFGNLSDADLSQLLESGYTLQQLFGFELNETTRTASVLMKNFGIDGQTAMDLITVGAQRGGNFSDELLDTLREYAPQFKGLGYNAEQFTAILVAGAESGAFNLDKIGDSAKESFLRIGDGSKSSRDALGALGLNFQQIERDIASGGDSANSAFAAVVSAISTVEDPAQRSQLAVALMGTPLEDLGPEFQNFFAKVNTDLGDFEGSAKKASDTLQQSFGEKFQSFLRNAGSALEPLGMVLMDLVEKAMPTITQAIDKASSTFSSLSPTVQTVIVIIGMLVAAIGPVLIVVGTLITAWGTVSTALAGVSLPMVAVIAGIALLVAAFVAAYTNSESFRDKVNTVFEKIKSVATNVFNVVASFIGEKIAQIKQFWDENGTQILQAVTNVFKGIKAVIDFVMPVVKLVIMTIWGAIKDVISGALNVIMGVVKIFSGLFTGDWSKMWEGIKQLVSGAIQLVMGWLTLSFFGGIRSLFMNLSKNGISIIRGMWDDIVTKFSGGITKGKAFIEDLVSSSKNKFANMVKTVMTKMTEIKTWITTKWDEATKFLKGIDLLKIGRDVVNGLIKGIKEKFTSITSALSEMADLIPSWVKDALGIHSPSRVMMEVGKWIPAGLAEGIKNNQAVVEGAMSAITTRTLNVTKQFQAENKKINNDAYKEITKIQQRAAEDVEKIERNAKKKKRSLTQDELNKIHRIEEDAAAKIVAVQEKTSAKKANLLQKEQKERLDMIQAYIDNKKSLDELNLIQEAAIWQKSIQLFKKGTTERTKVQQAYNKTLDTLNNEIVSINETYQGRMQQINADLTQQEADLTQKYKDAVENRRQSLMGFAGLFEEFKAKVDVTGIGLLNNLQSQVSGFKLWQSEIDTLTAKGIDGALLEELRQLGPDAVGEIQALNTLTAPELEAYSNLYKEKAALARDQATKELVPLKEKTENQISELRTNAMKKLDELNIEWGNKIKELTSSTSKELSSLKQIGINAGQSLLDGLSSMEGPLIKQAKAIANSISSTINSLLGFNPSITQAKTANTTKQSNISQTVANAVPARTAIQINPAPVIIDGRQVAEVTFNHVSDLQYGSASIAALTKGVSL